MNRSILALAVVLFLRVSSAEASDRAAPPELREFAEKIDAWREAMEVPCFALAVVKDDEVVFSRGFGVRRIETDDPVDDRTLFAIGSTSKAFTTAALAMLVDAGELDWDDRVIDHLPDFRLSDPYVTREMRVRDLLTHRVGIERADVIWYATDFDRAEVVGRARHLRQVESFRSVYGYNNMMYIAAGLVVETIAGKSWDDFVGERIFTPLGMSLTNTSTHDLVGNPNVAANHVPRGGLVEAIPYKNIDNAGPAGSINSSVRDMAEWIRLQLGGGVHGGRRLIAEASMAEMHKAQTIEHPEDFSKSLFSPISKFTAYALGWNVQDHRGRVLISHAGGIGGMNAYVGLIPEENLGVVALAGYSPTALPSYSAFAVFDAYLGETETDWGAEMLKIKESIDELIAGAADRRGEGRTEGTSPSLDPAEYAGDYESDWVGRAAVAFDGSKLILTGSDMRGALEHWHYDTFLVRWRDHALDPSLATFVLGSDGAVARLEFDPSGEMFGGLTYRRLIQK